MRGFALLFSLASILLASTAPGSAEAQGKPNDGPAAKAERRERYTKLAESGDRGDFAAACVGFAQLDIEEPNETFLRAALRACVLASDLERTAELTRRADRAAPSSELAEVLRDASAVLGREGGFIVVRCEEPCKATVDGKEAKAAIPFWAAPGSRRVTFEVAGRLVALSVDVEVGKTGEVAPPAPTAPKGPAKQGDKRGETEPKQTKTDAVESKPSSSGISPVFFFVGLGLSAALGAGSIASAVDTKNRHDEFEATGLGADDGESAQLRTNVLFFSTLGVGLATGAVGIFATNWAGSDEAAPDGAVARLTLSF